MHFKTWEDQSHRSLASYLIWPPVSQRLEKSQACLWWKWMLITFTILLSSHPSHTPQASSGCIMRLENKDKAAFKMGQRLFLGAQKQAVCCKMAHQIAELLGRECLLTRHSTPGLIPAEMQKLVWWHPFWRWTDAICFALGIFCLSRCLSPSLWTCLF